MRSANLHEQALASLKGSALSWGGESCLCPLLPLSKPALRLLASLLY